MKTLLFILPFVILFLLLPIIAGVKLYFDGEKKRLYFGVYLYGTLRIAGGYMTFGKTRATVLIGKKEIRLPYKEMFEGRKKFDIFSGFGISEITALLDIGSRDNAVLPVVVANAFSTACGIVLSRLKCRNGLMNAYGGVNVYEGRDVFRLNFNLDFIFNPAVVISALSKKLLEKMING